jgi:ABC-type multidrug transport system fused ATPase/permease subunit
MVIDKGELKEFASHKELMEIEDGIYRGLVMAQRKMSKIAAIKR